MEDQNPTELHTHEGVELVCIYAGEGVHLTEYGNMPLKSGDIFVIPRGFAHGYEVKKKLSLFNLLFIPERLPMPQLDLCQLTGFADPEELPILPHRTRRTRLRCIFPARTADGKRKYRSGLQNLPSGTAHGPALQADPSLFRQRQGG